ncbi:MAG TPA: prenyltransferase/squalene oxidase repeat-containing protein [Gemmatimonadaceae bacterium]|nr:prenyltransferase/squalene oxidase repeat-containing protein [Gemmatimonadaceae bacterium]
MLLPDDPNALIGDAARRRIAALASCMLPIPRIAVECRLTGASDQVDIQQCIRRDDGEFSALADHAASLLDAFPHHAALLGLNSFCSELVHEHSLLRSGIEEIFLEYDLPAALDAPRAAIVPGLFFSLPEQPHCARRVVLEAISRLRVAAGDAPPRMIASIERCFAACDSGSMDASISNIGVMLGRTDDVVRMNVKGLRPSEIDGFLTRCEWPGDRANAARLFDEAVNRADRVTLALDVGETLLPRIGVECFFDEQPARDPSWHASFDELVEAGLCSQAKANAFVAIQARLTPATTAHRWPEAAIVASLARDPQELSTFERRAVHFKITEVAGRRPEAKAYFGAGHLWRTAASSSDADAGRTTPSREHLRRSVVARKAESGQSDAQSDAPIDGAIERGTRFLLHRQRQSGLWRDFNLPSGISDEWVSGFIGAQLVVTADVRAHAAAEDCCERLARRQRASGGWGYNRDHPPDADSTVWALRLAAALGRGSGDVFQRGAAFVARHCLESGGVACYVETFRMATRAQLPSDAALSGLLDVQDCVTGAAAPFVPNGVHAYLRSRQRDGRWIGFFWVHDAYATAFAVEALRARPDAGDEERLTSAEAWAMAWLREARESSRRGTTTAFDASFCVRILNGSRDPRALRACRDGVDWLLAQQRSDGGWSAGARLRVPLSGSADWLASSRSAALDSRRAFSTAAAIGALAAFRTGTAARGDKP